MVGAGGRHAEIVGSCAISRIEVSGVVVLRLDKRILEFAMRSLQVDRQENFFYPLPALQRVFQCCELECCEIVFAAKTCQISDDFDATGAQQHSGG
jgi:hypothetical protein